MNILPLIIFILFEIIQTWFILFEKKFSRGIRGVILTEVLELPLLLYLILQGEALVILTVIVVEILQWLLIATLFNFLK